MDDKIDALLCMENSEFKNSVVMCLVVAPNTPSTLIEKTIKTKH